MKTRLLILSFLFVFTACPRNYEDFVMLHLYLSMKDRIWKASHGTNIPEEYLAAVISLESSPPGNWNSTRFEPHVYERFLATKHKRRPSFLGLSSQKLNRYSDQELRSYSSSYGPTQIMGYNCLKLNCSIKELQGPYHLQWAIVWMQDRYGKYAAKKEWEACFRIHNTGRPHGKTYHKYYVEKGLRRMNYYKKWVQKEGRIF